MASQKNRVLISPMLVSRKMLVDIRRLRPYSPAPTLDEGIFVRWFKCIHLTRYIFGGCSLFKQVQITLAHQVEVERRG